MEPSQKHPEMERHLTQLFGFDRRTNIQADKCAPPPMGCGGPAAEFKDDLSRKEFSITGLCQACQDKIFTPDDDDV